ncbi:Uncharacterized protein PCOAH_00021740 [Plasmodium coatneyi]|uniref:Uncharacterized protein n=1 Tax=Plasmodium coatneyi TaxID=208452 RepID=A0A1B1DZD7_9APIC|nr:Uncharacterized protein PCOAH_00021740 [Plasmodium coatneyi]ANQ07965.1 Uncharacterized protein PCOAH_00021740 [Plasmodium coatneyi]
MAKHVTFLYLHKCREKKKNKKYIYMNFVTKGGKNKSLSLHNLPHHKRSQKTIAIIPPIYKYIVQDSLVMENLGLSKKNKLNKTAEKDILQKQQKRLPYIYYLIRTSIHDSPYLNFFLFFFVISLFSSLLTITNIVDVPLLSQNLQETQGKISPCREGNPHQILHTVSILKHNQSGIYKKLSQSNV